MRRTFSDGHRGRTAGPEESPFRVVVYDPEGNTTIHSRPIHSDGLGVVDNPPVGEIVALVSKRVGVETAHLGATQAGALSRDTHIT